METKTRIVQVEIATIARTVYEIETEYSDEELEEMGFEEFCENVHPHLCTLIERDEIPYEEDDCLYVVSSNDENE